MRVKTVLRGQVLILVMREVELVIFRIFQQKGDPRDEMNVIWLRLHLINLIWISENSYLTLGISFREVTIQSSEFVDGLSPFPPNDFDPYGNLGGWSFHFQLKVPVNPWRDDLTLSFRHQMWKSAIRRSYVSCPAYIIVALAGQDIWATLAKHGMLCLMSLS